MFHLILGIAALSVIALIVLYAVFGRAFGVHRKLHWAGGGNVTFLCELALAGFVGSIG